MKTRKGISKVRLERKKGKSRSQEKVFYRISMHIAYCDCTETVDISTISYSVYNASIESLWKNL